MDESRKQGSNLKKMTKTCKLGVCMIALFVIALGGAIVYGQRNMNSYIDNTSFEDYLQNKELKVLYYHYPFDEQYDIYGAGDTVCSFQDVEHSADVIIKGTLNGDMSRRIYEECVLSEVEIMEVYKSDHTADPFSPGETISVFEPVNCTGITGQMLCSQGYSPMQGGREYFLFLKRLKNARFGANKYVYIPSTITYSKYSVGSGMPLKFKEKELEEGSLNYSDIKDQEVFLYDKKMYDLFCEMKVQANKAYKAG